MSTALLIFPHHLFADHPGLDARPDRVVLIEDALFFGDALYTLRFHKQKLWLHRASMTRHADTLSARNPHVTHQRYCPNRDTDPLNSALQTLAADGIKAIVTCDPVDFILARRLQRRTQALGLTLQTLPSPLFLNTDAQNQDWRKSQKRWFMADYYKAQRRSLNVLMDGPEPRGGQWSFDADNRKAVSPAHAKHVPALRPLSPDRIESQARAEIEAGFPTHYGRLDTLYWPTSHAAAAAWLDAFLRERFGLFGPYEDAILKGETLLWHSAITPMLNIGLLTPQQVLTAVQAHLTDHDVPLNSAEGFIRQIIGWREFMRATYTDLGVTMRTTNHWQHTRKIPHSFWTGQTGIAPIDDTIKRILDTGYCHHIERLMVLGGFMFLCEFDPGDIYRWFMELFVDAYDWVMVPNVYAMSQNADGGLITTKPYFSGSAYIRKMSNHKPGNGPNDWSAIWDALYWRWVWTHADALEKNPRWSMMVAMARKMDPGKRGTHLTTADRYLAALSAG